MKNILSYQPMSTFSGKEIKDWISFNLKNNTSHTKQAKMMEKFLNLRDDKIYHIKLSYPSSSAGKIIHKPIVVRFKEQ